MKLSTSEYDRISTIVPNATSSLSSDSAATMLPISSDVSATTSFGGLPSQNRNLLDVLASNFVETVRPMVPAPRFKKASTGRGSFEIEAGGGSTLMFFGVSIAISGLPLHRSGDGRNGWHDAAQIGFTSPNRVQVLVPTRSRIR